MKNPITSKSKKSERYNNGLDLWNKNNKPWITYNTYFDKETGFEVDAKEIPGNYIIINIEKNVRATKTHRIAERTITVRKPEYKQQRLF